MSDDCKSCYRSPNGCRCRREWVRMLVMYVGVVIVGLGLLFAVGCDGGHSRIALLESRVDEVEADLLYHRKKPNHESDPQCPAHWSRKPSAIESHGKLQSEVDELKKQVQCGEAMLLNSIQAVRPKCALDAAWRQCR